MTEFKVNKLITLKFRYPNTEIYVNGRYFMLCKRLLLNIPKRDLGQYEKIDSIDEAAEVYDHSIYKHEIFKEDGVPDIDNAENFSLIRPEEEFWGHCSNLQVWVEHDYDTRLMKSNLAFPLLEQLTKVGEKKAQIKFKEEIIARLISGYEPIIEYLFVEAYIEHLSNEELILGILDPQEAEILLQLQRNLDITFKFVPSIDRGIAPIDVRKIKKIRKFTVKNKRVQGLEFTFNELVKLPNEIQNLKSLKHLRLYGDYANLNSNDIKIAIQKLKRIEKIWLRSQLAKNLENSSLKDLKKIGKEICSFLFQ
jgi:hypothetical protein